MRSPGSLRVDPAFADDIAVEGQELDFDHGLGHREVEEAILSAAHGRVGRRFGCDAATPAGDEATQAAQRAGVQPELLVVPVTRHQQVQAVSFVQMGIVPGVGSAREVRDHDLPVGVGHGQFRLQPPLLLVVRRPKPALAIRNGGRPTTGSAIGIRRIVLPAAEVVHRVFVRILGVVGIGVDDEVLHGEAGVEHLLAVVPPRHDPVRVHERVADLLRPSVIELIAAVVMVAQCADPRLVGEAAVDTLPGLREALAREARGLSGGAFLRDARPIQVVADVKHVLWIGGGRALLHDVGDEDLGAVVDALNVAAILRALLAGPTLVGCGVVARQGRAPIADGEDVSVAVRSGIDLEVALILEALVLSCRKRGTAAAGGRRVVPHARRQERAQGLGVGLGSGPGGLQQCSLDLHLGQSNGLGIDLLLVLQARPRLGLRGHLGNGNQLATPVLQSIQGAICAVRCRAFVASGDGHSLIRPLRHHREGDHENECEVHAGREHTSESGERRSKL
mmetsp:Transcript_107788/g.285678  ORF Transcript_107788/g.285678 Transcript_107788/m.285678 type:complete len:507 (+) Transcript_107788:70-1590(+)